MAEILAGLEVAVTVGKLLGSLFGGLCGELGSNEQVTPGSTPAEPELVVTKIKGKKKHQDAFHLDGHPSLNFSGAIVDGVPQLENLFAYHHIENGTPTGSIGPAAAKSAAALVKVAPTLKDTPLPEVLRSTEWEDFLKTLKSQSGNPATIQAKIGEFSKYTATDGSDYPVASSLHSNYNSSEGCILLPARGGMVSLFY